MSFKNISVLAVLGLVAILVGCTSANGPLFTEGPKLSSGQSGVYIYREDLSGENMHSPNIIIDGETLGLLKHNGYVYKTLNPGRHKIVIHSRDNDVFEAISVNISDHQQVYLHLETATREYKGYVSAPDRLNDLLVSAIFSERTQRSERYWVAKHGDQAFAKQQIRSLRKS